MVICGYSIFRQTPIEDDPRDLSNATEQASVPLCKTSLNHLPTRPLDWMVPSRLLCCQSGCIHRYPSAHPVIRGEFCCILIETPRRRSLLMSPIRSLLVEPT